MAKLAQGTPLFFEGLTYHVVETPTSPQEGQRQSRFGHFLAAGKRGEKHPTVDSHPKHLEWLESAEGQEALDAELGAWFRSNSTEKDPALRKSLDALVVANHREATVTLGKLGACFYLPGRLIRPPVPRPEILRSRRRA